jgi:hypothetical protein
MPAIRSCPPDVFERAGTLGQHVLGVGHHRHAAHARSQRRAVVAGTATVVSGSVSQHSAQKTAGQQQAAAYQQQAAAQQQAMVDQAAAQVAAQLQAQQAAAQPAAPPAATPDDRGQIRELGEMNPRVC